MPYYVFLCPNCMYRTQVQSNGVPPEQTCSECASEMRRDWKYESVTNTFKPSVDTYANDLSRRSKKKKQGYF